MDYVVLKSCEEVYRVAQSHVVNIFNLSNTPMFASLSIAYAISMWSRICYFYRKDGEADQIFICRMFVIAASVSKRTQNQLRILSTLLRQMQSVQQYVPAFAFLRRRPKLQAGPSKHKEGQSTNI